MRRLVSTAWVLGTAFPFNEASRNFTYCIHLFFKIYCQREEIHAFPGGLSPRCGHYHCGIAIADQYAAVGLFADFAEFQRQGSAAQVHCVTFHLFSSYTLTLSWKRP